MIFPLVKKLTGQLQSFITFGLKNVNASNKFKANTEIQATFVQVLTSPTMWAKDVRFYESHS